MTYACVCSAGCIASLDLVLCYCRESLLSYPVISLIKEIWGYGYRTCIVIPNAYHFKGYNMVNINFQKPTASGHFGILGLLIQHQLFSAYTLNK